MRYWTTILFLGLIVGTTYSQSKKPAAAKPKSAATSTQRVSEITEWEKAIAVADPTARISALKKFVTAFPKSTHVTEALGLLSAAEAGLGNEKLTAGDSKGAMKLIIAAVKDAPKPIPDQLFTETLSKFPTDLYFRGLRDEAFEIARALEGKTDTNADQLSSIAGFYVNVENGAEARRVAESAIRIAPNSSGGYYMLGIANRVDFRLEESAAAYAKALEIDPELISSRRGLAEMKRALGKPDEAIMLYREILARVDNNVPAQTGLILALFDADKRAEAEAEMAKSLEANPGNVILLASAAYWYAAHNDGARAVELAQKAIAAEPRFIWSHIALARGLLSQGKPSSAEKTLIAARQYGNFPTLEYEIASARLAAGLYREAAEELSKSFSVKDGVIRTNLGGRVPSESKVFTELIGPERRASIFAPTAADSPDNAAQLKALLEFKQELKSTEPGSVNAASAADEFIRGDDKMKIYRQIFAASELLEKRVALPKVLEITSAAPSSLDAGLDVAEPATAVMAGELYESRTLAASRGEYVNVPVVSRSMLSAVLRGRIEEISGWANYQMDDAAQAVVHLKRAAGVLPVDSAYWRSSTWRLGTALVVNGNDAEALDAYVRSYKSSGPDVLRYNTIEAVYKRVKGSTLGLEQLIGPNPSAPSPSDAVSQKIEPTSEIKADIPAAVPANTDPTREARNDIPAVVPIQRESTPGSNATAQPSPTAEVVEKEPAKPTETPQEIAGAAPGATSTVAAETTPSPTPEEIKKTILRDDSPTPTSESTPEVQKTPVEKTAAEPNYEKPTATPKELFPPVVITIPAPESPKASAKAEPTVEPSPTPTPEITPCTLMVENESVTIKNNGGVLAVVVKRESDGEVEELKAISNSPQDVTIRREPIEGLKTQALFIVRSVSTKTGVYQVTFEMPCGKKEITVKVQ